jgi:uncharacterized protein (TIGR03118 family)
LLSLPILIARKAARAVSRSRSTQRKTFAAAALLTMTSLAPVANAQTAGYTQTNLISDGSVTAANTNTSLINPWGLSIGGAFWIDTAGTGLSLVTDANGSPSFNVAIPPAASTSAHGSPTGTVFNSDNTVFPIPNSTSALFLFATLDGTIAAWNASTPQAVTVVNNSSTNASYTDIALNTNSTSTFLLAANFAAGTVDVFDKNFAVAHLAGSFSDPGLPAGYSPFGIHSIGGKVYVTYAQLNPATGHETVGAGLGYVDVFDANGNLLSEAIAQGALNAPWGMALAPSGFGTFAGDLLVGNFGDGTINAFDPASFALKGTLQNSTGTTITNSGLWEIVFGTSNTGGTGDPNTLYLAAGLNGGQDGLVAAITVAQPTSGTGSFNFSTATGSVTASSSAPGTLNVSLTGTGGFTGPVTLSCSGLPSGTSCSFSPVTVQVSGTSAATSVLTVSEAAAVAPTPSPAPPTGYSQQSSVKGSHAPYALALLGPLGLLGFAGVRRRRTLVKGLVLMAAAAVLSFGAMGCSSNAPAAASAPTTPTAPQSTTTQFTVNATSGTTTQSMTVTLTLD